MDSKSNAIIKLMGGLGNQMFQYSFAYLCLLKFNINLLILDIRAYKKYYWPFELYKFKINENFQILDSGKMNYDFSVRNYHISQKIYELIHKEKPSFISDWNLQKNRLYCGTYCELPKTISFQKPLILYGYFQNADLLEPIRDNLCEFFTPKKPDGKTLTYLSLIKEDAVLLSIRLLSPSEQKHAYKENTLPTMDYYKNALKLIRSKYKLTQLVIMSNKIDEVKKFNWINELRCEKVFIEGCSAVDQIEIMKKCKYFIMSNSTFSWWGAYLGTYLHKGVAIAPPIWGKHKKTETTKMVFKEMIIFKEDN